MFTRNYRGTQFLTAMLVRAVLQFTWLLSKLAMENLHLDAIGLNSFRQDQKGSYRIRQDHTSQHLCLCKTISQDCPHGEIRHFLLAKLNGLLTCGRRKKTSQSHNRLVSKISIYEQVYPIDLLCAVVSWNFHDLFSDIDLFRRQRSAGYVTHQRLGIILMTSLIAGPSGPGDNSPPPSRF